MGFTNRRLSGDAEAASIGRASGVRDRVMAHTLHDVLGGQVLGSTKMLRPPPEHLVRFRGRRTMLYTIAVILLIMWLLGLVSGYTIGAFIHVLLIVAIVLFLVGLLSGRRFA